MNGQNIRIRLKAFDHRILDARRQRDRPADACARALRRADDLARRLVEHAMIVRPEADPDILAFHLLFLYPRRRGRLALAVPT